MNFMKKFVAVVLVALLALSAAGCHPKNEVAVKVGDFEFTSAYYMCALVMADTEARSKVDEAKAADTSSDASSSASDKETDYYSQKVEDTDYVKWVKDKAMNSLKEIAAYKTKCAENKLEIPEDDASNAEAYASYYWSSYGYSQLLEPNGVSESTYKQYMKDSYYSGVYFEKVYGKDGEKEIPADEVLKAINDNYVLADLLEENLSEKEDAEKTTLTDKFNAYAEALRTGAKTFKQVKTEHTGETEEQTTQKVEGDNSTPLDELATLIGGPDTTNPSEHYADVKDLAVGEVKVITNDAEILLVVKQDVTADPYYVKQLDIAARNILKGDEYKKDIEEFAKTLKAEVNNKAVDRFKVKKIVYPTAQ